MSNYLDLIATQFDELLKTQPLLQISISRNEAIITGLYCVHHIYEDEEFSELFKIKAFFSSDFPRTLFIIKEIGGRIRRFKFEHIYQDRTLCLEVDTRMKIELNESPTLPFFFERYVLPYFLSYLYYEKYQKFPFGERLHGEAGLLEFYCELLNVDNIEAAKVLLGYVCESAVKGHSPCPCQSGNRYRNCHRSKVNELKESKYYDLFISDYKLIIKG